MTLESLIIGLSTSAKTCAHARQNVDDRNRTELEVAVKLIADSELVFDRILRRLRSDVEILKSCQEVRRSYRL